MAKVDMGLGGIIGGTAEFSVFELTYHVIAVQSLAANGTATVEQVLELPRNAIVRSPFEVVLRAGRAEWIRAADVSQIRQKDITSSAAVASGQPQKRTSVVIDFGVLRTVAGVGLVSTQSVRVIQVKQWTGAGFAVTPVIKADPGNPSIIDAATELVNTFFQAAVEFASEIRTERLQIDLTGSGTDEELSELLLVKLPDAPADLELRINDQPPVWTSPGAVVPGARGWTEDESGLLRRTVDLSGALTALLGDASADRSDVVQLRLVLSARVPGAFVLELPPENARVIRFLRRVDLAPTQKTLDFAGEGMIGLPLALPSWASAIDAVRLTLTANLSPERVLPPVGPAPAVVSVRGAAQPFAELVLDSEHAASVALPSAFGLAELLGIRLPLRAEPGGVELRALLLNNADGEPGEPIEGAISEPGLIDPVSGTDDVWMTVLFPGPVPLDSGALPFLALHITRGRASWSLSDSPEAGIVWRGPPAGPWQRLPDSGGLALMRGRFRLIGHGSREAPVAPLQARLAGAPGSTVDVTPTPKGSTVELKPEPPLALAGQSTGTLELIGRVRGTVTINEVLLTLAG